MARYFDEVDRLQNIDVDNPEASASALIGAATSGDTSGLRQLVSQASDTEQKVRAITPPAACAHYHQQLLSMLAESHSMLQRLEQGMGSGGLDALPALVSQANAAKSRSEKLAEEARELKRRYGVAH
jgi:ATPase subunit of ABC transporter with duplicated ATPase domains